MRGRPVIPVCLILALGAPGQTLAQNEQPTPARDLARLVEPLDDPLFEVRQEGQQRLAEGVGYADLVALLASASLSPEAHARVRRAALERFGAFPRAGMGVSFQPVRDGIQIQTVMQTLPAATVIRPGDTITSADGIDLGAASDLGAIILSHDAGDLLPVTVRREGETFEAEIPLVSFEELRIGRPNEQSLTRALRVRLVREGVPERAVTGALGATITREDWARSELGETPPDQIERGAQGRIDVRSTRRPAIGGTPRTTATPAVAARTRTPESWLARLGMLTRQRALLEAQWELARSEGASASERADLRDRLSRIDAQLAQFRGDDGESP